MAELIVIDKYEANNPMLINTYIRLVDKVTSVKNVELQDDIVSQVLNSSFNFGNSLKISGKIFLHLLIYSYFVEMENSENEKAEIQLVATYIQNHEEEMQNELRKMAGMTFITPEVEKARKILMGLMVLGQLTAVPAIANAAPTAKEATEIKKYDSLDTAAKDYAKALQEISNYGSREMLKSINPDVDKYVAKINDPTLKKQWEDSNTMLIEQFEVSVYKVNENGNDGEVVFLIKGYDEKALDKYLGDNASQYAKVDSGKDEVEVDIEKYIKLQYNYLKNTKKINLATSTVKFAKGSDNKWQVTK